MTYIRRWTLSDVVLRRMCTGCAACVFACDGHGVILRDVVDIGLRPFYQGECVDSHQLTRVCPGLRARDMLAARQSEHAKAHDPFLGSCLEQWEGWAADPSIRLRGSSGGLLTALALYCMEVGGMGGVLQAGMDPDQPWRNRTFLSRSREEILRNAGSRYSPTSPCDGLRWVCAEKTPSAFIGKPTDVTAVQLLREVYPELDRKLGVVMTFFCAGTPSTQGTLDLLSKLDVNPEELLCLNYRGNGWPGGFEAITRDGNRGFIPYESAWSFLSRYKPLRENLDPDGFGRNADISCGDAWHVQNSPGNPGISIAVVRTELGQRILHEAEAAGYVVLRPTTISQILLGQASLVNKQKELYGRHLGFRLLAVPCSRFEGFDLKKSWSQLTVGRRVRVLLGTFRRIVARRLWRPLELGS